MREVGKRDAENIQGVWKILPLKKVEQYFWSQDILYEQRVSVATMLKQFTYKRSYIVVRRMRNSQSAGGGAALA